MSRDRERAGSLICAYTNVLQPSHSKRVLLISTPLQRGVLRGATRKPFRICTAGSMAAGFGVPALAGESLLTVGWPGTSSAPQNLAHSAA